MLQLSVVGTAIKQAKDEQIWDPVIKTKQECKFIHDLYL